MIYTGENQIKAVKQGDGEIRGIYVGTRKIYPFVEYEKYVSFTAYSLQRIKTWKTGTTANPSYQYSFDQVTWTDWDGSEMDFGNLPENHTLYMRGKNPQGINHSDSDRCSFVYGLSGIPVTIGGNIMALIDWENPPLDIPCEGCFYKMFDNSKGLVSVDDNFLPATGLTNNCYHSMFEGDISLTHIPNLPAKVLKYNCYAAMFCGCTALTVFKPFIGTTLESFCYADMYNGTSITDISNMTIAANTLAQQCFERTFANCKSLKTLPSAFTPTQLGMASYGGMFQGCTGLETVPFNLLPVTNLSEGAYQWMFAGCTSLKKAPNLPATVLSVNAYKYMFQGCSALCEVHCAAEDKSANSCTGNWLDGVATAGTFYGKSVAGWGTGKSQIPSGWLRLLDDITITGISFTSLTFRSSLQATGGTATSADCTFTITANLSDGSTGNITNNCTVSGEKTIGRNTVTYKTKNTANTLTLTAVFQDKSCTGDVAIIQDPGSPQKLLMLYKNGLQQRTITMPEGEYYYNFNSASTTYSAFTGTVTWSGRYIYIFGVNNQNVGTITLGNTSWGTCYYTIYGSVNALTDGLNDDVSKMKYTTTGLFDASVCTGWTYLEAVADGFLPSTEVCAGAYQNMFNGCSLVNTLRCDAKVLGEGATTNWLNNVYSTGTLYASREVDWESGPSGLPEGWSISYID